ncbi:MAP7 domain-containing protein 2 isoform X1 [Brienomyrus brachyistius]|uniref:MAP7 domain-containing protein 2 isoform X1 n=1 Tax=Brienomyrus brachyistius TaxID=42636 RepID=UPI0020B294DA|nr:MAP7 domain-containing protein 2 isoform X1 [Brienomyrus brachyistius]
MEQPAPGLRRRSDGSVRENLFFPVLEQNMQQKLVSLSQLGPEHSDPRVKRWTWAGTDTPPEGTYGSSLTPDLEALPGIIDEYMPPSPQRSMYQRSLSHTDEKRSRNESPAGTSDFAKMEPLGAERCTVSLPSSSPIRRPESPATPTRRPSLRTPNQGPGTPRRAKSSLPGRRGQSPCPGGLYPPSPLKNGSAYNGTENRKLDGEEKGARNHVPSERRSSRTETPERKMPRPASRELAADASPVTPTGKPVAGTTDAEEATRILAERRRQARLQKEQEEKQRREQEEEERLRKEELRRQQEEEERHLEEKRQREERERRHALEEERWLKEQRWRDLQAELERERVEVEFRAKKEAERKRIEREMLKLQEEQERLQRKKRIEEIMKRTRKTDPETKKDAVWVEPSCPVSLSQSVSSSLHGLRAGTGEVNMQANVQVSGRSFGQLGPPVSCLIGQEVDDLADEVQAMDVSPVSKEELLPVQGFLPAEIQNKSSSSGQVLDDLLRLTGFVSNPKLSPEASLGDCNKNVIEGFCPSADSQMIQSLTQRSGTLSLQ